MRLLLRSTVPTAIKLNRETCLDAVKIQNIPIHRMIPAKLVFTETAASQPTPHQPFCPSCFKAQRTGLFNSWHKIIIRSCRSMINNEMEDSFRFEPALNPAFSPSGAPCGVPPETLPACWSVPAAGSSVTLAPTQNHSNVKPSPRGRGQGEGERSAKGGRLAILFQRLALTLTHLDFSISELPSAPAQPVAKSPQSCLTIPAVEYKLYPCASLKKRSWWRQGGDIPRQLVTWRSGARRSRRLRGAIWWMCGNVIRT